MLIGEVDREIIELFSEDIAAFYSINQIAKKLGKKYPYINKRVSALLGKGILKKSVLGNTYLCSINLTSDIAVAMLCLIEVERRDKAASKNKDIQNLVKEIKGRNRHPEPVCAVVSGNRLIFVAGKIASTAIPGGLARISTDRPGFIRMLCESKVLHDHIILFGFEAYFGMIAEAEKELRLQQVRELP